MNSGTTIPLMSALGQKQTFCIALAMSALPPKADMCGANRHVRFGPIADIAHRNESYSNLEIHSGRPALRKPSAYLMRSSRRRRVDARAACETRNVGST